MRCSAGARRLTVMLLTLKSAYHPAACAAGLCNQSAASGEARFAGAQLQHDQVAADAAQWGGEVVHLLVASTGLKLFGEDD